MKASVHGHTATVQALIGAGADLNLQEIRVSVLVHTSVCVVCVQNVGAACVLY
jgi:hypothetical protein